MRMEVGIVAQKKEKQYASDNAQLISMLIPSSMKPSEM